MNRAQPRLLLSIAALGLLAAAGAIALVLTSDHEPHPAFTAVLGPVVGLTFIGAGLVAWWRRPDNRFGALMGAVGFTWFLGALSDANESGLFTLGCLLGSLALAAFAHAVLAYPTGMLESRLARAVVIVAYVDVTIGSL